MSETAGRWIYRASFVLAFVLGYTFGPVFWI